MVAQPQIERASERVNNKYEVFENNRLRCVTKILTLTLRDTYSEAVGKKGFGLSMGSISDGTLCFVFDKPTNVGNRDMFLVLTPRGYRGISFNRDEEGNKGKEKFEKSLDRYEDFRDSNKVSADLQGFSPNHKGDEQLRCPNPDMYGFGALMSINLEKDISPDVIQRVERL